MERVSRFLLKALISTCSFNSFIALVLLGGAERGERFPLRDVETSGDDPKGTALLFQRQIYLKNWLDRIFNKLTK